MREGEKGGLGSYPRAAGGPGDVGAGRWHGGMAQPTRTVATGEEDGDFAETPMLFFSHFL